MDSPTPEDSLSRTLQAWRVVPPRHPQFRAEVARRIETGGAGARSWTAFARAHAGAVAGVVALALAAGAFAGRGQARARVASDSSRMAAAYVDGLDARSMRMR